MPLCKKKKKRKEKKRKSGEKSGECLRKSGEEEITRKESVERNEGEGEGVQI
jgi:hypothetical protein